MRRLDRDTLMNRIRNGGNWYAIRNADDSGVAHVRIYETIGGWFGRSAKDFAEEIDQIEADEIVVSINSLGGDVFDGIAIYNALRMHPARITTQVDAMAASIASVIAQAGDTRQMVSHSQMMIHEAWGITWGTADEMRSMADVLDRQTDNIAGIYADRSGGDAAHFRQLMEDETWFTDQEATDEGLADEVIEPASADDPDDGDGGSNQLPPSAVGGGPSRFSEHIAAVVTAVDELTDRVGSVVTLRTEQGKPVDDTWRSREHVDRLAAALNRLNDHLTAGATDGPDQPSTARELEAEWLQFIKTTQGV